VIRLNLQELRSIARGEAVNSAKTPKPVMSFRIDRILAGKLRGAAKHTGLKASQLVQDAVALHIERLEKKAKKPFPVMAPRKYGN
jgi:hypothetical protein